LLKGYAGPHTLSNGRNSENALILQRNKPFRSSI